MSEDLPPVERHVAVDRFGKTALRAAAALSAALAESGSGGDEPIVLRTDGRHRSIEELAALLDAALADASDERPSAVDPDDAADPGDDRSDEDPTAGRAERLSAPFPRGSCG